MKVLTSLVIAALSGAGANAAAATPLTVSAAASLKQPLAKLESVFAAAHPRLKVTFNFAGSGALQQQIGAGAPVDVFISAAARQMDALEAKGLLLPDTRRDLLTNTLVLITAVARDDIKGFEDLTKSSVERIAIGDPKSVPAGTYAAAVFASLGISDAIAPKLVRMLDVQQVLMTVATRNATAGVVYATDARLSDKVRVAAMAQPTTHPPIVYPVAVLRESKERDAARLFVDFLGSKPARSVFADFGFGAAP